MLENFEFSVLVQTTGIGYNRWLGYLTEMYRERERETGQPPNGNKGTNKLH